MRCWALFAWGSIELSSAIKHHGAGTYVASSSAQPTFFLKLHPSKLHPEKESHVLPGCDPDGTWQHVTDAVKGHPWRVYNESAATFSVQCLPWDEELFLALPERSPARPYIFWGLAAAKHYANSSKALRRRSDFVFASFDLREQVADEGLPGLPGVTMAPPLWATQPHDPAKAPRHLLTYRGKFLEGKENATEAYDHIQESFSHFVKKGVFVEFVKDGEPRDPRRYKDLLDTAYALVPSVHGRRWSTRLTDVILACAIPVLLDSDMALPYKEIIDWSAHAITLYRFTTSAKYPRDDFQWDPAGMLSELSDNQTEIRAMRKRVCDIGKKYFDGPRARFEALLSDAAVYKSTPHVDVRTYTRTTTTTAHVRVVPPAPSPPPPWPGGQP